MIYLVGNTKGGVGKSTMAVHLAAWLAQTGKVLLVDADPQKTSWNWSEWRRERNIVDGLTVERLLDEQIPVKVMGKIQHFDNVVIDAGGRDNAGLRFAMQIADRLIVPLSHSSFDSSSFNDIKGIIDATKVTNKKLDVIAVISRVDTRRKPPTDLREFLAVKKGIRVAKTQIAERTAIKDATDDGLAVFERRKSGHEALMFEALFDEIVGE